MPEVRHKTLRRKLSANLRPLTTDAEKIRSLRALYMIVYNSEDSLIPLATELFHTLGDILEGIPPEELRLHRVDRDVFLQTYEELS